MSFGLRRWIVRVAPGEVAPRSDWEGVYERFADVPAVGDGFDDAAWVADTRRLTESVRAVCTRGLAPVVGDDALLPLLAAAAGGTGTVKVLDFGGGLGISFVQLCAALPSESTIEYHVVERSAVCAAGEEMYRAEPRIRFHLEVPAVLPGLDIVYLNSALQYVEDWRGLIARLCRLSPSFMLLARCSAGDTPTFVTAQTTLPGKKIPYWFLNRDELAGCLREHGYSLRFAARATAKLDQARLPERYRQGWTSNLLFCRAGQG